MALKIIPNKKQESEENSKEQKNETIKGLVNMDNVKPYMLGTFTNWGNLDVGILEEKYVDRYICLENKHEMMNAYIHAKEINDCPGLTTDTSLLSRTLDI